MKPNYYCPRCGTKEISEYQDTFECTKCRDTALRETSSFVDTFEELRDSEKRKKYFESLSDDDLEA
jgi:tRNA(Ile2) C34 agmatinyltransferase TiaS